MKKYIVIGDIHGRDYWKEVQLKAEKYDKIIFVGDYVDSFYKPNPIILKNLREIINFKRNNFDKVVLLLGNHDVQYLFWDEKMTFCCSGFRPEARHDLMSLFKYNKDCFQVAYQVGNLIISHAGITNGWYKHNKEIIDEYADRFETTDLADTFNTILWTKENKILHQVGRVRDGWYSWGGITWADRKETSNDPLIGYHQIVGHTPITRIEKFGDEKASVRYVDVLAEVDIIRERIELEIKEYGSSNRMDEERLITKFYEFELKED